MSTPTMVVVSAELQMVHQNMVKLRTMPMTSEMTTAVVKPMDLVPCSQSDPEPVRRKRRDADSVEEARGSRHGSNFHLENSTLSVLR